MAFASTYNTPGGIQTDVSGASAGFPGAPGMGGMDMGWLMEMAKRRAAQKLQAGDIANQGAAFSLSEARKAPWLAQQDMNRSRRDAAMAYDRQRNANPLGQQQTVDRARQQSLQGWNDFYAGQQTGAQKASSMTAGLNGQAYSDMMRQIAAQSAAGVPTGDYTGWTDLTKALNAGGAGASAAAGELEGQKQQQNDPLRQAAAQQAMANRMYPGLAQRLYPPAKE